MSGAPQKRRWKSFQWALECLLYTIIESLVVLLPLSWVFRIGEWIGGALWHIAPKRQQTILRNLRVVFANEKSAEEIHQMAKASFCRTAANLLCAARTARLSPGELTQVMRIKNPELAQQALGNGRGVVILLAHMGNWEVLSRLIHLLPEGTKAGAFYRPLNNPMLDERVRARRQADGTQMFSKRDNPLHVATFLRDGGIVGILADQRVGIRGKVATYFGRATRASPLPSLLARRSKSTVIALAVTTTAPGRWELEFVPVDNPPNTENCMRSLETVIKTSPIDVFWLQDRWKTALNEKQTLHDWLGSSDTTGPKHHRALLWLAGAPKAWRPPESWSHPDLVFEAAIELDTQRPDWLSDDVKAHEIPEGSSPHSLAKMISTIDHSEPLPLDFILTPNASDALKSASRSQAIPVISTP